MATPNNPKMPHLVGITLDSNGVGGSQVIAVNTVTGERQIKPTNSDKVVIFDMADFPTQYGLDLINFTNIGGSVGRATATINSLTGGFQDVSMTTAAAPTVAVNL